MVRVRSNKTETLMGVYDHPRYYDIGFSWDPSKEVNFLEGCFEKYGRSDTKNILELGCGTGRLLIELARCGYRVVGLDKSSQMIEYLSEKARRLGIDVRLIEADMENFAISEKFDAAFCAINTFRYILTEKAALDHLRCVGESLMPGGVYTIDFVLLGLLDSYPKSKPEEWIVDREDTSVKVSHRFLGVPDSANRLIVDELTLTVKEGETVKTIRSEDSMRTYTHDEFESLVEASGHFKIVSWHGPDFNIDKPIRPGPESERVEVVLKRL